MSSFILRHKKKSLLLGVIIIIIIVTTIRNLSYGDMLYQLNHSGMEVRPILGEESKAKRDYFALGGSFIFLTITKVLSSDVKKNVYINLFKGKPMKEATRKAVEEMPEEEKGMLLEADGVTIEVTRFRHPLLTKRLAILHTRLSEKDRMNANCDNPEYINRMTCANLVYIPKKNFLIIVSDIKDTVDIINEKGKRIARDYEAVSEERLQEVIDKIKNL